MDIHFAPPPSISETQKVISDAERRNAELGVELANERRQRQMDGPELSKELVKINAAVERQLRRCHELDIFNDGLRKKIVNAKKRRVDQTRMAGGELVTKENARLLKRQTEILEDKLSMAFKKFNTTLDKNAKLREKIDKLVNERHIFGKIYTRIEEEVVLYQEETEQVRLETEQREEMCKEVRKKIEELIKQDREESSQFEATVGSKQGEIKVSAKEKRREAQNSVVMNTVGPETHKAVPASEESGESEEHAKAGSMTVEEEKALIALGARHKWEAVQNRMVIESSAKRIAEIRKLMEGLQEVSGERDVNKLAELFRKNEDSMFELAGKINEDSKKVELLQREIDTHMAELERDDGAKERRAKAKRQMQVIRQTRQKSRKFADMKRQADAEIVALNSALESICRSMQGTIPKRPRLRTLQSRSSSSGQEADSTSPGSRRGVDADAEDETPTAFNGIEPGTSNVMRNLGTLEHIYRVLMRSSSGKVDVKRPDKFLARSVAEATKLVHPELNSSEIFGADWHGVPDDGTAIWTRAQSANVVRRFFNSSAGKPGRSNSQGRSSRSRGNGLGAYNSVNRINSVRSSSASGRRSPARRAGQRVKTPIVKQRSPAPGRRGNRRSSWAGNTRGVKLPAI